VSCLQDFLGHFPDARQSGAEWAATCPAHEDHVASLSIGEGDDGRVLLHCHAGCSVEQICDSVGLSVSDLYEPAEGQRMTTVSTSTKPAEDRATSTFRRQSSSQRTRKTFPSVANAIDELAHSGDMQPADNWSYHNADGAEVLRVVRFETERGKSFRPIARTENGWVIGDPLGLLPLFGLPELLQAGQESRDGLVFVCEGEKAADAAQSLGLVATTSAHGAKSPKKTDWSPLAGRNVIILPDNDEAGYAYAEEVTELLEKLDPKPIVHVVELPELPEHGDIVDLIIAQQDVADTRDTVLSLARQEQQETVSSTPEQPLSFAPFPVSVLPEPISSFVNSSARAIGCDSSFLALPLLSAFAAAIGTTRQIQLKPGWCEPAILWTVIIGDSGTLKTPAFKVAMKPLRNREQKAAEEFQRALAEHKKAELAHKQEMNARKREGSEDSPPDEPAPPERERVLVSDITVEALAPILKTNPRGVLVSRDELAGWVGSFDRYTKNGGGDLAHWLSMHNAENLIVDRKTGFPPSIFVPMASVSVTGGIQPGILSRVFNSDCRESGLMARLLLAWPPRKAKRWTDAGISWQKEKTLSAIVQRLLELEPFRHADYSEAPVTLQLTDDAHDAWVKFYNAHADEEVGLEGELASAWSKLEASAARLALVIHLVRWAADDPTLDDSEYVDAESITAGVTLANWFGCEARRVYAMLSETDEQRATRKLVEWIERRGGCITTRQLQQGCREYRTAESAQAALQQLVELGIGQWIYREPSRRGGRPTEELQLMTASPACENLSKPAGSVSSVGSDREDSANESNLYGRQAGV